MRAVVIHAEKDLRVEPTTAPELGPRDVRVRIEAGGICGSDLHYYLHGGFGTIRVREPMILGHEIAGRVEAIGGEVSRVKPGSEPVITTVSPDSVWGTCAPAAEGSSAIRTPAARHLSTTERCQSTANHSTTASAMIGPTPSVAASASTPARSMGVRPAGSLWPGSAWP